MVIYRSPPNTPHNEMPVVVAVAVDATVLGVSAVGDAVVTAVASTVTVEATVLV